MCLINVFKSILVIKSLSEMELYLIVSLRLWDLALR